MTLQNIKYAGLAIIGLIVAIVLYHSQIMISSGNEGVLMKFGSVQSQPLHPGLHVLIPEYETAAIVSVQPETITSAENAATLDLQNIETSVAITYHIDPDDAPFFYENFRNVQSLATKIIKPTVSNDVRAITAHYNAEELITKRDEVDAKIKDLIVKSLLPYRLHVEAINTSNFSFSASYADAIEAKQVQQQNTLKAQYSLDQEKIDAQKQVVQASANAEAQIARAKGDAQATILTAQAQSKANELVSSSLTPIIIQQQAIARWNGTLPSYMTSGANLPFIGTLSNTK